MSIKAAFKKKDALYPPSSRSFHAVAKDLGERLQSIENELNKIRESETLLCERINSAVVDVNHHTNEEIEHRVATPLRKMNTDLETHDTHMKIFAWEGVREKDEPIDAAKKRFFANLPTATGAMRLLQLGCAQLLKDFSVLCSENDIPYWIAYGTLLGAARHGGFIPWDDDMDVCMMREDIDRLLNAVENDQHLRITTIFDRYVYCKQIRIRYADEAIPCFIDIFIFDYIAHCNSETYDQRTVLRSQMIEKLNRDESFSLWEKNPYLSIKTPSGEKIASIFESYRTQCIDQGIIVARADAKGVMYGFDNLDDPFFSWVSPLEDIFPLQPVQFEGIECSAPKEFEALLASEYGDILELPNDINTHFKHVSPDEIKENDLEKALEKIQRTHA